MEVREYVETLRTMISSLRDPFSPIAKMSQVERIAAGERVLWEDDAIMVLVDRFSSMLKPLVIPKSKIMFPIDAPPELMQRLAVVAAATSDAMICAADKDCDPKSSSRIYINPPNVIGVRQLHVHVQLLIPAQDLSIDEFYTRVTRFLSEILETKTVPDH